MGSDILQRSDAHGAEQTVTWHRRWVLLVVALLAVGCSSGEVEETQNRDSEAEFRSAGNPLWEQAFTNGRSVTVTLLGGIPGVEEYSARVVETDEVVSVIVDRRTREVGDVPAIGYEWAITAMLDEPLGDRQLRGGVDGERPATPMETRLEPTWLPSDFRLVFDNRELPQRTLRYGPIDGSESSMISLLMSPITMNPRLHGLRQIDGYETISIRNDADGVSAIQFDGNPVVGFEEQGWYYRVVGFGVETETLVEFVRSFERPTLVPAGSLPDELTVPLQQAEPQPGQE